LLRRLAAPPSLIIKAGSRGGFGFGALALIGFGLLPGFLFADLVPVRAS